MFNSTSVFRAPSVLPPPFFPNPVLKFIWNHNNNNNLRNSLIMLFTFNNES